MPPRWPEEPSAPWRSATFLAVELETMRRRFREARVGRLATVTMQGCPHLAPCCFVLLDDTVYSAVDAKPKSTTALQRLVNVRTNPSASLLVDHYDDADWEALWWIRVDGRARVVDPEAAPGALRSLCSRYPQYRLDRPPGPLLEIRIERWTAWP